MAKKREWKAWMVVTKKGHPFIDSDGASQVSLKKYCLYAETEYGERIIRVRIVEE